jgi:hypothetical protein
MAHLDLKQTIDCTNIQQALWSVVFTGLANRPHKLKLSLMLRIIPVRGNIF